MSGKLFSAPQHCYYGSIVMVGGGGRRLCLYFAKEAHVLAPACIPLPLIHVTPQDTGGRAQGMLCSLHLQVTESGPRIPGSVRRMVAIPTA